LFVRTIFERLRFEGEIAARAIWSRVFHFASLEARARIESIDQASAIPTRENRRLRHTFGPFVERAESESAALLVRIDRDDRSPYFPRLKCILPPARLAGRNVNRSEHATRETPAMRGGEVRRSRGPQARAHDPENACPALG